MFDFYHFQLKPLCTEIKKFRNKIEARNKKYMYSRKHCRVLTYSFKNDELNSVANRYVA